MAKRFPLVVDTENNNRIIELPVDDCLDLTGSDICSVENITVTGTITLPTGPVTSFTGNYSDLADPPPIPSRLIDLGILDGNAGQVLITNGNGNFYFGNQSIDWTDVGQRPNIPSALTDLQITDGVAGTYLTTDGEGNFTFADITDVNLGYLSIDADVITNINPNGDIVLKPTGSGYLNIDTVTGIKVPVGTTLQRSPNAKGVIRFNDDLDVFEGYNGTGWASLGGVRSLDGETYILAETTPGAGDDKLLFYTDGVLRLEINNTEVNFDENLTVNIPNLSVTNLQLEQSLDLSGDITIGDTETDTFTLYANIAGNLIPKVHDTYDVGSRAKQWQNLFVTDRVQLNGLEFPKVDGEINSSLGTNGQGQLEWQHPDKWGGNRVYVSAEYGDDDNDGVTAPVRTVKKGLQIAGGMVFEPVNKDQFVEHETKILRNAKRDIADAVIKWIADTYGFAFGYDTIKCRRDMDLIIDAILLDQLLGTNYNAITAGLAYQRANSSYVTGTQNLVTLGALDELKNQLASLGLWNTSVNELQDSIDEISDIFTNGVTAANNLSFVAPPITPTPASEETKFKLINNKEFIKAEIIAWIGENHPTLVYDSAKCNRDVGYIIDGLCHDITYGGNYGSITNAKSYFVGTQGQLGAGETTATVEAYQHMQTVIESVITGITITTSVNPLNDIDGNPVSQITTGGVGTVTEVVKCKNLIQLIIDVISDGSLNNLDKTFLPNYGWSDIRRKDAYNTVKREQSIIKNNVINHINSTNGFYDSIKCHRDVMEIVDAVTYDLRYGGNSRSVTAGESYYDANNALYIGQSQKAETIAAIEYARDLALTYVTGTNATAIEASMNLIASILDDKANAPAKTFGNARPKTVTVMVATGDYVENNPMIIPDNVSIFGDNLRRSIIRPQNANRDLFRVRNGVYLTGLVFRDHVDTNGVPDFTFRYGISFDNPADTATSRAGYIDLPASRPLIFTSPYIQNVSVISFLGAGGTEIDGNLVDVPNIPPNNIEAENPVDITDGIPEQGKSMVANAYTILSFGGNAWRVINDAYAQIVSCFVIFCENGCLTQNGGYLSITNSASNFGLFSLRSTGYSQNSFIYDRGFVFTYYTIEGFQVFRVCGLKRAALEHYVIRLKTNNGQFDITDDFTLNGRTEGQKTIGFIPNTTSVVGNEITFPLFDFNGDTGVDVVNDRIVFDTPHPYHTNNAVTYSANGNTEISGLTDNDTYYVQVVDDLQIRLFQYDQNGGKSLVSLTATSTGTHQLQSKHEFVNGDYIEYDSNGDAEIVGLLHELKYFVSVQSPTSIALFHDEARLKPVRNLDASVCQGYQNWKIGFEYIFIEEVVVTHNTYQDWILPETVDINGVPTTVQYNVILGNEITCVKSTGNIIQTGVAGWDPLTRTLTVSLEETTEGTAVVRNVGDPGTLIPGNTIWANAAQIPVLSAVPRDDLYTSDFKVLTTLNSGIDPATLQSLGTSQIYLHRPSICNSSAHTWEFAGSGIDYNALPQNGGLTDEYFEQVSTTPGRVYSSGTNEIGDFKVGNFVRAYNRTGNIDFKNKVNIGELDSLALSLSSGIVVTSISGDIELGDNEVGGPSNSRLITQLAIYTFLNNRLGDFIDKKVSTNAIPSSVVQLNSSGQINSDLIPPTGNFTAYIVETYKGRLLLHEDIPVVDLKAGDIVIEEYDEITLTVSGNIALTEGDLLEQVDGNGIVIASAYIKQNYLSATEIKLIEPFFGTFSANVAANILQDPNGALTDGNGANVYPLIIAGPSEIRENYFITTSRAKQYLVTLAGETYDFTNTTTIQGAISGAVGDVDEYRKGVLTGVDVINGLPGGGEYTPGDYVDVQILYSSSSAGSQLGSEALADVTVNSSGEITTFDLKRGGINYEVGESLTVATLSSEATISGATFIPKTGANPALEFSIDITTVEDRLYITLNTSAGLEFNASSTNIDFIIDDIVTSVQTVTDAQPLTPGFQGTNIDTVNDIINTNGAHGLSDGDIVIYDPNTNNIIQGLDALKSYYVKVIDVDQLQLFDNYALTGLPINLGSTPDNGSPAQLQVYNISLEKNTFYIPAHGLTGGDAVKLTATDPPLGLNDGGFYFVGSVTDNTFTLHVARGSAIDSVNGLTKDEVTLLDRGTGTTTLRVQTVIITGDANTSGQLETSWSNLTSTTIDADNIISGIINTARLGTGSANTATFLRGDNSWQYAVTGISNSTLNDPITMSGPNWNNGTTDVYYGDIDIKVERTGYLNPANPLTNEATVGVAGFAVEHFKVTNGIVEARNTTENGEIDALTLGGQNSDYYRNPVNLSRTVPIEKGGTNLATYTKGDILYAGTDLPTGNAFSSTMSTLPIGVEHDVMVVSNSSTPVWTSNLVLNGATIDAIQIGVTGANIIDTVSAALPADPWDLILDSQSGTTKVDDDLIVTGNLTVSGTTTTINSTAITIDDPIFTLGGDTAPTTDDNKDRGIEFRWHNGISAKIGFFGFDDSTGYLTFIPEATNNAEVFSGTQGDIQASNFRGALIGNADTTTKWQTARTVTFENSADLLTRTGVTGSFTIDGTADISNVVLTIVPEVLQDMVGDMVAGVDADQNGIAVTYDDTNGKLDFDVNDFTITLAGDLSGSVTITDLGNGTLTATVVPNSVALDTDTTGNYVSFISIAQQQDPDGQGGFISTDGLSIEYNNVIDVANAIDGIEYYITSVGTTTQWNLFDAAGDQSPYNVNDTIVIANGPPTGNGQVRRVEGENTTVTLRHADTSNQASSNNTNNTVIQSISLDTFGHITSLGTVTIDTYSGFNIFSDSNAEQTVLETNKIKLVSGTNVAITQDTQVAGTTQFTIASTDTYVSSVDFATATGILTLTRNDGTTTTKDLDGRYLTSFSETDTLNSVTGRGNSTTNSIVTGGLEASASSGPYVVIKNTVSNTATGGALQFKKLNTNAAYTTVSQIYCNVSDRTPSALTTAGVDSQLQFKTLVNDTEILGMEISGNAVLPKANNDGTLGNGSRVWNTVYATTFSGTATQAQYADLAEMYTADKHYTPGTVMMFGGDKEVTAAKGLATTKVIGVVSTNPAYLMNSELENGTAIALKGRVPCLVVGKVEKGDMLVASDIAGVAIATQEFIGGAIIGKAIEASNDTEIKVIEIAVGVL